MFSWILVEDTVYVTVSLIGALNMKTMNFAKAMQQSDFLFTI